MQTIRTEKIKHIIAVASKGKVKRQDAWKV